MNERDPEYDWVEPLPREGKRGRQCGECGQKFEYGEHEMTCGEPRCPMGLFPRGIVGQ